MKLAFRSIALVAAIFTTSCRVDQASPVQQPTALVSSTAQTAAAVTQMAVTSASTTVVSPNGVKGETDVPDNFTTSLALEAAPAEGPSADAVGAFRFFCTAGQLLQDDPLVYPGQPGVSHLHQFAGNTGTNASSNYQSLRTSGGTTCGNSAAPVQRSAYWIPAMLDGVGNAVKPDKIMTYYKRIPASNPACGAPDAAHVGYCTDLPNGLRFIFGYNMTTGLTGPLDTNWAGYDSIRFTCVDREGGATAGPATGIYHSLAEVVAAGCPANAWLNVAATIPDCWDGVNLDTADHRSHMAPANGAYIAVGDHRACPADHPYLIDNISAQFFFTTDANFVAGKWHLSSDEMVPGAIPGSTMHMDYWEAWSPAIKATWHQYCLNGHLSCSSGDLGDGTQIAGMGHPSGSWPTHILVPLTSLGISTTTTTTTTAAPPPTTTTATQTCAGGSVILVTSACPVTKPGKAIGRRK
jgi:hypothetical protein